MSNFRVWLFLSLVAVAASLMVISFILPWWGLDILVLGENVLVIHPYGLSHSFEQYSTFMGQYQSYIEGSEMPVWFAPLMWAYLGICIAALLYALLVGGKEGKWGKFKFKWAKLLIGGVGISYILIALLAVTVAAIRTGEFYGISLLGYTYVEIAHPAESGVVGSLQPAYWMAHSVGFLCIALALVRDKIVGKPKPS